MSLIGSFKSVYNSEKFCKLLLVLNALLWGYSFLVMKDVVALVPVGYLLAIRFIPAAFVLAIISFKRVIANFNKETIVTGVCLGLLGCAGYLTQTFGLTYTTPGKNAFLTGVYAVMVPFCAWLIGLGKPERYNVVGAFVALLGLGFVALDNGFPLNIGDLLTLLGAFFYALQMAEVAKRGPGLDVGAVTMWEFLTLGLASLLWGVAAETPPDFSAFTSSDIGALVFLSLICSCFTITTSNHAFTKVDPTAGALLSSLESPFGVLCSVVLGYEMLTGRVVIGFILILLGVLFSEAGPNLLALVSGKRRAKEDV